MSENGKLAYRSFGSPRASTIDSDKKPAMLFDPLARDDQSASLTVIRVNLGSSRGVLHRSYEHSGMTSMYFITLQLGALGF